MSEKAPLHERMRDGGEDGRPDITWSVSRVNATIDFWADEVEQLTAKLLAHTENEGSECPLCTLEADLEEYKEGIEVEREWKREAYRRNRQLRTENKTLRSYKKEVEDMAELMFQFMMQRLHE